MYDAQHFAKLADRYRYARSDQADAARMELDHYVSDQIRALKQSMRLICQAYEVWNRAPSAAASNALSKEIKAAEALL